MSGIRREKSESIDRRKGIDHRIGIDLKSYAVEKSNCKGVPSPSKFCASVEPTSSTWGRTKPSNIIFKARIVLGICKLCAYEFSQNRKVICINKIQGYLSSCQRRPGRLGVDWGQSSSNRRLRGPGQSGESCEASGLE